MGVCSGGLDYELFKVDHFPRCGVIFISDANLCICENFGTLNFGRREFFVEGIGDQIDLQKDTSNLQPSHFRSFPQWRIVSVFALFGAVVLFVTFFIIYGRVQRENIEERKENLQSKPSPSKTISPQPPQAFISSTTGYNFSFGTIYFLKNGEIASFNEITSELKSLTQSRSISHLVLHSNSRTFFYLEKGDIWQSDLDGKPIKRITYTDEKVTDFQISPDGNFIAFLVAEKYGGAAADPGAKYSLTAPYIIKIDGTGQFRAKFPPPDINPPYKSAHIEMWYPDSRRILLTGGYFLEASTILWEVDIVKNTIRYFNLCGGDYKGKSGENIEEGRDVSFSPQGTKFTCRDWGSYTLLLGDIETPEERRPLKRAVSRPVIWAPDGRKMVASIEGRQAEGERLVVFDLEGKDVFRRENLPQGQEFRPLGWSSDSRFVAGTFSREGEDINDAIVGWRKVYYEKLVVVDLENKSMREFEFSENVSVDDLIIAPSGRIYYTTNLRVRNIDTSVPQLWMAEIATGNIMNVTDGVVFAPVWVSL